MRELRARKAERLAAEFAASALAYTRCLAASAYHLAGILLGSIFTMLWRAIRGSFEWLCTKSAEARRNAHRPLLRLVPWLIVAFAWMGLTLASVIA